MARAKFLGQPAPSFQVDDHLVDPVCRRHVQRGQRRLADDAVRRQPVTRLEAGDCGGEVVAEIVGVLPVVVPGCAQSPRELTDTAIPIARPQRRAGGHRFPAATRVQLAQPLELADEPRVIRVVRQQVSEGVTRVGHARGPSRNRHEVAVAPIRPPLRVERLGIEAAGE